MAIVGIDLKNVESGLSPRDLLRAVGYEVKAKGRLSADQQQIIDAAQKQGYEFEAPAPVVEKAPVLITQKELELEPLRQWMIDQGMPVQEKGRIAQTTLNAYIEANPDAPRRSMLPDAVVSDKPTAKVDPKAVKRWADSQKLPYPQRGRLPRTLIESYMAATNDAGTEVVVTEPDHSNNFGPAAPRVNMADFYEGYEFSYDDRGDLVIGERVDNEKGGALVKKSWKDCDVKTGYSIGYVPGYSFAFDPRDSDDELVLLPVR